jgi:ubiquinone/menaquinone biosynthesis C-methylase UbiE
MTGHPPICDYEGSDYQNSFWDKGDRNYEDQVEAIALKRLLPASGNLLLEVGAGAGRNTSRYQGFARIVLMDYSLTQMQQAQARLGRSDRYVYVAGDIYRPPFFNGVFDGATMIRVIHHLSQPIDALSQIRRIMQPGGVFILEFANKQNLKAIARYLLRQQDWNPFNTDPVEFVKLNYNFHPKTINNWLEKAKFKVQRKLTVSHFRIGFLKRNIPTKLLVRMDAIAQLSGDWWQLTPSVFCRSVAVAGPEWDESAKGGFFRCPICEYNVTVQSDELLVCDGCGKLWPIVDGIYDFRVKND